MIEYFTELNFATILMLFCVALLAGFVDSIAGGGGLITMPVLLSVNLHPLEVLATNKLQASGSSVGASFYFLRKKLINLKKERINILVVFLGAACGAQVVQLISVDNLRQILPIIIFAVGLYFLFFKIQGEDKEPLEIPAFFIAFILGAIGFYDGFFGPGTGSFFVLVFNAILGFGITKATAHAKLMNATSNIASLMLFISTGKVIWFIGFIMLLGQFIGATCGARLAIKQNGKIIRPMIVIMSFLMCAKLLFDQN